MDLNKWFKKQNYYIRQICLNGTLTISFLLLSIYLNMINDNLQFISILATIMFWNSMNTYYLAETLKGLKE